MAGLKKQVHPPADSEFCRPGGVCILPVGRGAIFTGESSLDKRYLHNTTPRSSIVTGGLLLILNLCQCLNLILSTDLLSLGNPFMLRKCPLCPAVTLKHIGTFGSIRQQYFASEVGRVHSHTCELVWNALSESDFRFAWGFASGLPAVSLSFQRLLCLGRSDLLCSGSSDLYSACLASLLLRLHSSGFSSMWNGNHTSVSSSQRSRYRCISMLTLLPEFRPYLTAVPEPFCCCN